MSRVILVVGLVFTFCLYAEEKNPALNPADSVAVNKILDGMVAESKKETANQFFQTLLKNVCEDVDEPGMIKNSVPRKGLNKAIKEKKALEPSEILVVSVIAKNEEFPGINSEGYLSKHGIPTVTLVGPTPAQLGSFLGALPARTPPFKKVFIAFSGHGTAVFEKKDNPNAFHFPRGLALGLPPKEALPINQREVVAPNLSQHGPRPLAMFRDYLESISKALPDGGKDVQITVDSCMSGAGLNDWLKLMQNNGGRDVRFGITLTAPGNETTIVGHLSTFEEIMQEVLLHGSVYDADESGSVDGEEFSDLAFNRCKKNPGVAVHSNSFFRIPILKTGSESAIAVHQSLAADKVYAKAIRMVQDCKACVGGLCAKPAAAPGKNH